MTHTVPLIAIRWQGLSSLVVPPGVARPSSPGRPPTADPQPRHGRRAHQPATIAGQDVTTRRSVSENETPHSGSRWEPGAHETTPQPAPAQSWPPPVVPQQPVPTGQAAPAAVGRGRLAMAAAAIGLVAAGGIGGFVVGQASTGNAGETGVVHNGVPGQFPGGTRPD